MTNKQAVVATTAGTFVIDLRPDLAPNHAGYFIKLAKDGAYAGTIFHRVIRLGTIQGGDPLSQDPAKVSSYGTGGLGVLKGEVSSEPATRGAVAAVIQPNRPDSAGAQFFVCVTDQRSLDGKYTIFGRVSEGMDVVQTISEAPATPEGMPRERIVISSVTIRDTPPPEHVRNFLRLAQAGVFDGTAFHRVVKGFAIQTGAMTSRGPLSEKQQKSVQNLQPEFNDTKRRHGGGRGH